PDRQQSRTERWIYNGSIYQSDEAVAPPTADDINTDWYPPRQADFGQDEMQSGKRSDRGWKSAKRTIMNLGDQSTELGKFMAKFNISKAMLPGHVFITGRTRQGKTTLLEHMLEQLPAMKTNFWAFDL